MANHPRFQFSLRTLLMVVVLCAVTIAAVTSLGLRLVLEFSGLVWSSVLVLLLALALVPFSSIPLRLPKVASFIVTPILYGGLSFVFFLFGEAIDQPHPEYLEGNWLTYGAANGISFIVPAAYGTLVVIAIDAAMQKSRPRDLAYYPRLISLRLGLDMLRVRLVLIIGGTLIVGYYAETVLEVWSACQRQCGWVWPPKRVFVVCHLIWGLLWLADCVSRPRRGTMVAAIGYVCLVLLMLLPLRFAVFRE